MTTKPTDFGEAYFASPFQYQQTTDTPDTVVFPAFGGIPLPAESFFRFEAPAGYLGWRTLSPLKRYLNLADLVPVSNDVETGAVFDPGEEP